MVLLMFILQSMFSEEYDQSNIKCLCNLYDIAKLAQNLVSVFCRKQFTAGLSVTLHT